MTQAEVIIGAVVLLALLVCAALLDRNDKEKDSLAVWTEEMFDEGDDVEDLEEHEGGDDD